MNEKTKAFIEWKARQPKEALSSEENESRLDAFIELTDLLKEEKAKSNLLQDLHEVGGFDDLEEIIPSDDDPSEIIFFDDEDEEEIELTDQLCFSTGSNYEEWN